MTSQRDFYEGKFFSYMPAGGTGRVTGKDGIFDVYVRREDDWWIIRVPSIDAVTQARLDTQVEQMARDLIAVEQGIEPEIVEVRLTWQTTGAVVQPLPRLDADQVPCPVCRQPGYADGNQPRVYVRHPGRITACRITEPLAVRQVIRAWQVRDLRAAQEAARRG